MHPTYTYITDLLLLLFLLSGNLSAQEQNVTEVPDTVTIPLKIRAGIDVTGPVIYFTDKNILNTEAYISADINEKMSLLIGAGYSSYKYSQYNYEYFSEGIFLKTGIDLNILKPEISAGRYRAGLGIYYGLSVFNSGTPSFRHEGYWGIINSSIGSDRSWGHYVELSPGFRAELFKNISIGWSVNLRKLIYPGVKKDIRPLWFPGYGTGSESVTAGISYFLSWNITYKKIRVAIKPEEPEEPLDDEEMQDSGVNTESQSLRGTRPATRIR